MPFSGFYHGYIDPSLTTGTLDGLSPANAADNLWGAGYGHEGDNLQSISWWRRGTYLHNASGDASSGVFAWVNSVVKWPMPGEEFYDVRPQAGIDAGWDDDPDIDPVFLIDPTVTVGTLNGQFHHIKFLAGTGTFTAHPKDGGTYTLGAGYTQTLDGAVAGNGYAFAIESFRADMCFYHCTFEPDDNCYIPVLVAPESGSETFFYECYFKQHTSIPHTLPWDQFNCIFGTEDLTFYIDRKPYFGTTYAVGFMNCTFDGVLQNDASLPDNPIRSGVVVCQSTSTVQFEGCTFLNTGGRFLGAFGGSFDGNHQSSVGHAPFSVHLISCDLDGYDPSFDFQTNYRGQFWQSTPYFTIPFNYAMHSYIIDADIPLSISAYRCRNHPFSTRYCLDTHTYRLSETNGYPRVGGNQFQYVIQTKPGIQSYYVAHARKTMITPDQTTWPPADYMATWQLPGTNVSTTYTVYVKLLGWAVMPAADDLFLTVHYIDPAPTDPYKQAARAVSTQAVSQNNQWTALSVTFAGVLNEPIQFRLTFRAFETNALIILDPAVETS